MVEKVKMWSSENGEVYGTELAATKADAKFWKKKAQDSEAKADRLANRVAELHPYAPHHVRNILNPNEPPPVIRFLDKDPPPTFRSVDCDRKSTATEDDSPPTFRSIECG